MINNIRRARGIKGMVTIPGDKSISHRGLLLGAIAEGTTAIHNLSSSVDVGSTLSCLQQLGVTIIKKNDSLEVIGKGLHGLKMPASPLDCGNSGTTMRLISGILAAQPFTTTLIGDKSLSQRPMKRIIEPMIQMGANIESQPGGFAPLMIYGNELNAIQYESQVASAQVKSAILLAGLYARGTTAVTEPHLSRDHTERMLADFGVTVKRDGLSVSVDGDKVLQSTEVWVPGDFSSSAFFIGAALAVPHSELTIKNVGLNPTRTGLLDVLKQMGAKSEIQLYKRKSSEPNGDISVFTSELTGVEIPPDIIPKLIDEIPILAVIATQAEGVTKLSGAKELRVKESDRLRAIVNNLLLMGIQIQENEDGFIIEGRQKLKGAVVDSYGDHRIAMAFAVAGLIAEGETQIKNCECVEISMPNFFETLQGITVE